MITIPVQALLAGDRIVSTPDKPDTQELRVTRVGWELDRIVFEYTCRMQLPNGQDADAEGRCALRPGSVVGIANRFGR